MNTQNRRPTAQIIQFPPPGARARMGSGLKAETKQNTPIFEAGTATFGGAWYHEAAMLEADRLRKP
jgi:hypothetical protein